MMKPVIDPDTEIGVGGKFVTVAIQLFMAEVDKSVTMQEIALVTPDPHHCHGNKLKRVIIKN